MGEEMLIELLKKNLKLECEYVHDVGQCIILRYGEHEIARTDALPFAYEDSLDNLVRTVDSIM